MPWASGDKCLHITGLDLDRKRFSTPNLKGATESVKRNALTVNQVTKILEVARTRYKITHYTALSLLFLTGMRAGELRALQWEAT